jgi:hypothetical protein
MISEFRKSIKAVLYERLTSPFSGAFFFSWFVRNWKLLYYLFFSNNEVVKRIAFVEVNFVNPWNNLVYPFLSSVFLIVLYPFISTGAFWVWLRFKNWQNELRNEIENKQLLTLEKSVELRMEIRNQQEQFDKILSSKTEEISLLKKEIDSMREQFKNIDTTKLLPEEDRTMEEKEEEFWSFMSSPWSDHIKDVAATMQRNQNFVDRVGPDVASYFISNDLVARRNDNNVLYDFTSKGKYFLKKYLENEMEDNVNKKTT